MATGTVLVAIKFETLRAIEGIFVGGRFGAANVGRADLQWEWLKQGYRDREPQPWRSGLDGGERIQDFVMV